MQLFDRILWRINGVIILGATILVGVLALYAAYEIFIDKKRGRNVRNIVTIDPETTDSNLDNLLTQTDERTLFLSRESGRELTQIAVGVVRVLGIQQLDEGLVYMFLQTTEGDFVYHLNIASKKVIKKDVIEIEG